MIYVKGGALWHAVRAFADDWTTTLCGRRVPEHRSIAKDVDATFLCRTCALAIARSVLA